ncbi:MAG: ABC transporter substrate-binding protein [Haloferacaceae archaeon]
MADKDRTTRRRVLKGTAAAGIAGLAGCSGNGGSGSDGGDGSSDGSGGGTPTQSGSGGSGGDTETKGGSGSLSTKLAVAHYPVIPDTAPFIVGMEKGIYEKHGVTIQDVTSFSGGGTTVRGIVTGGIGMGGTALPALIQGYNAGAPIYVSGLEMNQSPINFHVLPDSDIESIQDCKGKTIAVSNPGSSSEAMTIASVKAADGISLSDIEIMHAGGLGEAITAMNEGSADVAWNIAPKSTAMLQKDQSRVVWWGRDYAPNVTEMVLAVGGKVKRENPEVAKRLLAAQVECFDFVKNNQKETAKLWAKAAEMPEDLMVAALKEAKPEKIFETVSPREEVLKSTAATMIEQGLIDEQPAWNEIVWDDPLPEDLQVDWP